MCVCERVCVCASVTVCECVCVCVCVCVIPGSPSCSETPPPLPPAAVLVLGLVCGGAQAVSHSSTQVSVRCGGGQYLSLRASCGSGPGGLQLGCATCARWAGL